MNYLAVGNLCAVDLEELQLPISVEEAMRILLRKGFVVREVDLVQLARNCVGVSSYRRGAKPVEAPSVFDCSSFTRWLYAQRGIWLPRRSIQQREYGEIVAFEDASAGDLVFSSGWIDYWRDDPSDGVGHVGVVTELKTVIHAANKNVGVIESSLESFSSIELLRGIRRYIPLDRVVLTLETPDHRHIEISDDLRWVILQTLPKEALFQRSSEPSGIYSRSALLIEMNPCPFTI